MNVEPAITAQGLTKRYGSQEAVRGVDFTVPAGQAVALLGPNGAGKSSTIRMICCVSSISGGRLTVLGEPAYPGNLAIKRRIGVAYQEDYLDPDLTVAENVEIYGEFYHLSRAESRQRTRELLALMELEGKAKEPVRALSGGMKRRLVIARSLVSRPDLVILDEPTTGLDPQARLLVWSRLRLLKQQGLTLLFSTHYMEEAERLADDVLVMDDGKILDRGTPDDLIARHSSPEVVEVAVEEVGERLRGRLEQVARAESQGERLAFFSEDADLLVQILRQGGVRRHFRRPGSLQDVFLRLTGKELRE